MLKFRINWSKIIEIKLGNVITYGSNSPKWEFTLIYVHKPAEEMASNRHQKCNLKSVKSYNPTS